MIFRKNSRLDKLKREKADVVRSLPKSSVQKLLIDLHNELDTINPYFHNSWTEEMQHVRVTVPKIEQANLNDEDASALYEILYNYLPVIISSIVSGIKTNSTKSDVIDHYRKSTGNVGFKEILTTIDTIRHSQMFQAPALAAIESNPQMKQIESFSQNIVAELAFPELSSTSKKIAAKLEILKKRWEKSLAGNNTPEDEHFLEQVVKLYLPNAWALYADFEMVSAESRAAVEAVLIEQLDIMVSRLEALLETRSAYSLAALKAQTEILREQTSQKAIGSLLGA